MNKFLTRFTFGVAAVAALTVVPSTPAAMISFSLGNFGSDDINVVVKLSDGADSASAGYLQVDLTIVPTIPLPNTGDLNGLFVGFNDDDAEDPIVALQTFPTTAAGGAWFGDDVTAVFAGANGGCNNLNGDGGGPASAVDIGVTLGICGSSSGLLTSSSVFFQGFEIGDIGAIGARVQTVGSGAGGGSGSSKLFLGSANFPPPSNEEVPEPATLTLMGAGLLGLMYFRRRRN